MRLWSIFLGGFDARAMHGSKRMTAESRCQRRRFANSTSPRDTSSAAQKRIRWRGCHPSKSHLVNIQSRRTASPILPPSPPTSVCPGKLRKVQNRMSKTFESVLKWMNVLCWKDLPRHAVSQQLTLSLREGRSRQFPPSKAQLVATSWKTMTDENCSTLRSADACPSPRLLVVFSGNDGREQERKERGLTLVSCMALKGVAALHRRWF